MRGLGLLIKGIILEGKFKALKVRCDAKTRTCHSQGRYATSNCIEIRK